MLLESSHRAPIQDLALQISSETDPVQLLPKVIALLYIQVLWLSIFFFPLIIILQNWGKLNTCEIVLGL